MLGFYNVIKATGQNSTSVVSLIKHITGEKCGHLGTLDPMAGGVLPIAVGKATKLFDWFLNKDKQYFAIGLFGVLTDTLDSEGKIEQKEDVHIKKTQIESVLSKFCGNIVQIPPKFSSVNINGKRAYDLAREGKNIELPKRNVKIYNLSVQEFGKNLFAFNIHCSAGTYVRSLILDIAKELGTVATTVCIIRTASGTFNLENSFVLDDIKNGTAKLLDVSDVIDLPHLKVTESQLVKLLNGVQIKFEGQDGDYLCFSSSKLVGIVSIKENKLKITINLWEKVND